MRERRNEVRRVKREFERKGNKCDVFAPFFISEGTFNAKCQNGK